MAQMLIKHGSEAGYRSEIQTDTVCERCRNGHRQFDKQYTRRGKAQNLKYGRYDVIDHLYMPGQPRGAAAAAQDRREATGQIPARTPPGRQESHPASTEEPRDRPGDEANTDAPSLADRVGEGLRKLVGNRGQEEYVTEDASSSYVHPSDADPEPQGWEGPDQPDEYVIDKAGMLLIEDNLGTYLSVLGITLEMIDPYCGPILAENFDNIVGRWTKVIARYPRAARLFMSKEGGTIFLWIGALQSTWPVLLALYDHHLAGNVKTDNLGRSYRVSKNGASKETVDATMPPQPAYAFTVD